MKGTPEGYIVLGGDGWTVAIRIADFQKLLTLGHKFEVAYLEAGIL